MKKILLLLSASLMILAGCGEKKEDKKSNSGLPEAKFEINAERPGYEVAKNEPAEINWYVNYGWYIHKWGESEVTKKMQEDTGIKVNFTSGDDQKLNALVASDSLPDVITLDARHDLTKSPKIEKLAIPLNELAEKYDPYFFKVANKGLMDWNKKADGNTYGYQNYAVSISDYETSKLGSTEVFLVRKDMYEAIGSPDMSTKTGFLDALKAVKEKFPEENGNKIIPLGMDVIGQGEGALGRTLQDFIGLPVEKDGKVYDKVSDSEYLAWVKVFRDALKEGYMTTDSFSDTVEKVDEKLSQGRFFAYFTNGLPGKQVPLNARMASAPNGEYIAVDGPKNSNGADYALQGQGIDGWTITFINKKAKNPERIIQLFTYMISEKGQETALFGKEGVTYDKIDGVPTVKPEIKKLAQENPKEYVAEVGIGELWQFGDSLYELKYRNLSEASKQPTEWTRGKAKPKFEIIGIDPTGNSIEEKQLQKINQKWKETLSLLILSKNDDEFQKIFNEFIEFRDKNNWDKIAEIRNANMNENKKRLGLN